MYRYLYLAAGFEEMKEIPAKGWMKQIYKLNNMEEKKLKKF